MHQRHFSRFHPLTYQATNDDFVTMFQEILFNHTTSNETITLEPLLEPFMKTYWPNKTLQDVKAEEQEIEIFFERLCGTKHHGNQRAIPRCDYFTYCQPLVRESYNNGQCPCGLQYNWPPIMNRLPYMYVLYVFNLTPVQLYVILFSSNIELPDRNHIQTIENVIRNFFQNGVNKTFRCSAENCPHVIPSQTIQEIMEPPDCLPVYLYYLPDQAVPQTQPGVITLPTRPRFEIEGTITLNTWQGMVTYKLVGCGQHTGDIKKVSIIQIRAPQCHLL